MEDGRLKMKDERLKMKDLRINSLQLILLLLLISFRLSGQFYPPETQLTYKQMPDNMPMRGYLVPFTDPVFGSKVIRVSDSLAFAPYSDETYHHYAKDQPWNSDGSLIMLSGWPSAILDGHTYELLHWVMPPGEHHTWSNTQPNLIYGIQPPKSWVSVDATTGNPTILHVFTEYEIVSYGSWEGNMSNDDHYVALQCQATDANFVIVYDLVDDTVVSRLNIGSLWPNNVSMSQSGDFVAIEWDIEGSGPGEGICIYTRDLDFVRNVSVCGGCHYDLGYDADGNEVSVHQNITGGTRAIVAVRFDNGEVTELLKDNQMSWPIHISCRNLNRPGWAYLSEFETDYSEKTKPNYQQIFGVKIDGSGTVNSFAHVHHNDSGTEEYERSPFGVPSREGNRVMFRSDWENVNGPIYEYIAEVTDTLFPTPPVNLKASLINETWFALTWTPSTGTYGITGYEVNLNDALSYAATNPSKNINGLQPGSTYKVTVKSIDSKGNRSLASDTLTVITAGVATDIQVPPAGPDIQVYPNPASREVFISYHLPTASMVKISIVDILGKEVKRIMNGRQSLGEYQYTIDTSGLGNSTYFIRAEMNGIYTMKKLVILKD